MTALSLILGSFSVCGFFLKDHGMSLYSLFQNKRRFLGFLLKSDYKAVLLSLIPTEFYVITYLISLSLPLCVLLCGWLR